MRVSQSLAARVIPASARDTVTPDGLRLLDWTNLNAVPESVDMASSTPGHRGEAPRLAILVNSPRMLRAADIFAEQAGLQGAHVRVFVDSKEAISWLGKTRH